MLFGFADMRRLPYHFTATTIFGERLLTNANVIFLTVQRQKNHAQV